MAVCPEDHSDGERPPSVQSRYIRLVRKNVSVLYVVGQLEEAPIEFVDTSTREASLILWLTEIAIEPGECLVNQFIARYAVPTPIRNAAFVSFRSA